MTAKIVECIPNFSEARRSEVMDQIIAAIQAVEGVLLLDRHSDLDHNRTVLTFIGEPTAVEQAAFAGIAQAVALIDLNVHTGEHPRIGAADVVPFVPIAGVSMQECVEMAHRLGQRVADELYIPIYFYEEAALKPEHKNLEDIRRGEFEGLSELIGSEADRAPDLGPAQLGPAGATVIGARQALIAYNIYLNTPEVGIAEEIARRVRNSSGGFHYVKAMGVLVEGLAQVSMNLTNFQRSPLAQVTEMVRREAQRYGVGIHHSEVVGLIPNQALVNAAGWYLQLDAFENDQILDSRLMAAEPNEEHSGRSSEIFLDAVAAGSPTPGGGSAAAYTGALAAALLVMVARLTVGKAKYAVVEDECQQLIISGERLRAELTEKVRLDSQAYEGIVEARRLTKTTAEEKDLRGEAILAATLHAAQVPLDAAQACLDVLRLAVRAAEIGNVNAISDAAAGANLAQAALASAALNVRINLLSMEDQSEAIAMLAKLKALETDLPTLRAALKIILADRAGL